MPTLYSSDMSSSTNRSKRSIRPPARFAKDVDGTENSSKRRAAVISANSGKERAAVISATTGLTSTSLSTSSPPIAENDLHPHQHLGTPPTTDVSVTAAAACVSTAPNQVATITMTECATAAPANLVEEAIEFASNINPENLPIRSNNANGALIDVQWQGEANALETFCDDPTFCDIVSQQDSILHSVLTAPGKNSEFATVTVAASGGNAHSEDNTVNNPEDSLKLPFGVSMLVYQKFVDLPKTNCHVSEVDVGEGMWVNCKVCDCQVAMRIGRPFQLSRWGEHEKGGTHVKKVSLHNETMRLRDKAKLTGDSAITAKERAALKVMTKVSSKMTSFFQAKKKVSRSNHSCCCLYPELCLTFLFYPAPHYRCYSKCHLNQ